MAERKIPVETPEQAKLRIDAAMHLHAREEQVDLDDRSHHAFHFDDGIRLTIAVLADDTEWLEIAKPPAVCLIVASADAESPAVFGLDPSSPVAARIFSKLVIQRVNFLLDTNLPTTMEPTDFMPPHIFMWRIWAEPRSDGSGLYTIPRSDSWGKGIGIGQP